MGEILLDPKINFVTNGFRDASGKPRVDFKIFMTDTSLAKNRAAFFEPMRAGLSNMAAATRWYVDRFLKTNLAQAK